MTEWISVESLFVVGSMTLNIVSSIVNIVVISLDKRIVVIATVIDVLSMVASDVVCTGTLEVSDVSIVIGVAILVVMVFGDGLIFYAISVIYLFDMTSMLEIVVTRIRVIDSVVEIVTALISAVIIFVNTIVESTPVIGSVTLGVISFVGIDVSSVVVIIVL